LVRWGLRFSACAARDVPVQGFHAIPRPFCALLRAAHTEPHGHPLLLCVDPATTP